MSVGRSEEIDRLREASQDDLVEDGPKSIFSRFACKDGSFVDPVSVFFLPVCIKIT